MSAKTSSTSTGVGTKQQVFKWRASFTAMSTSLVWQLGAQTEAACSLRCGIDPDKGRCAEGSEVRTSGAPGQFLYQVHSFP